MSKRDPATRPARNVPHPTKAGGRFEVHKEETNGRRKRRFGDPKDSGAPGRGTKDWPQLRAHMGAQRGKRIGGKDLGAPRRPAICFLYEDLAELAELEGDGPEQVFGMYPRSFIPKILPWLLCDRRRVVHVCSGGLPPGEGIRVDIRPEARPDILADGRHLPFEDGSVDALLIDPPYTEHYARDLYGVGYPRPAHLLREAARVVKPQGRIGFVHYITPNPPPYDARRQGLRPVHRLRLPDARRHHLRARAALAAARRREP